MTDTQIRIHPLAAQGVRQLASGRWVVFDGGKIVYRAHSESDANYFFYGDDECHGPSCWVCDGYHEGRGCPVDAYDQGYEYQDRF